MFRSAEAVRKEIELLKTSWRRKGYVCGHIKKAALPKQPFLKECIKDYWTSHHTLSVIILPVGILTPL